MKDVCQIIEENELPERLLRDAGVQGIDELVEAMDLSMVVAYARRYGIEFEDQATWRDDEYPSKESWLRVMVMEHMAERTGKEN